MAEKKNKRKFTRALLPWIGSPFFAMARLKMSVFATVTGAAAPLFLFALLFAQAVDDNFFFMNMTAKL